MKRRTVAARMAWSFAAVFACGLLVIAVAAWLELSVQAAEACPATIINSLGDN